ncbi:2-hydroxyisoflavanone dehydratase-like protein, partial [Tanacetum coccineum]
GTQNPWDDPDVEQVKNSDCGGDVELVEYKGEGHCFSLFDQNNPTDDVFSKDITISPLESTFRAKALTTTNKLPVLVYYHGGGFCLESAFCALFHRYVNSIVSKSQSIIAISVEYILAPENPLPVAYEDSWVALNWVTSHFDQETYPKSKDQWILDFANFDKLYIGGDSEGANIAHNMAIRAAIRSETSENREDSWLSRVWRVVYPDSPGGDDNPMVNPFADGGLRVNSDCGGDVELVEYKGEGHCFVLFDRECDHSKDFINRLVSFV